MLPNFVLIGSDFFPVKYVISCVLVCNGEAMHPDLLDAPEQQVFISSSSSSSSSLSSSSLIYLPC